MQCILVRRWLTHCSGEIIFAVRMRFCEEVAVEERVKMGVNALIFRRDSWTGCSKIG